MCFKVEPSRLACRFIDPSSKQPIDEDRPLALGSVVHLETNVADRTL